MKRTSTLAILTLLSILLASCSISTDDPFPTPAPTVTAVPTLLADALSVGKLLARVETAWPSVQSMRTTFWSTEAADGGTPPATGMVTVEEVVLPASRRVVVLSDGMPTDEQIAVDGRIYMKGALVPAAIAPLVNAETWVEVDPAAASTDSPVAMQVSYLLSAIVSPFSSISPETAGQEAIAIGEVIIGDRTCQGYTFGDAGGILYELTLDERNLPCRLVQKAGASANVTVYDFNIAGLAIAAPDVATPPAD
ncbi:MAG: hypothetical protein H0T72_08410 [Chloroflexia bacterium]|nr:hypothetical protein [Chloroflexia bacterium]